MKSAWLGGVFYLWSDVVGKKQIQMKVAERTVDDVDFIRLLHSLRGWIGADRTYRPLSVSELEDFLDFGEARRRAEGIALRKESYAEDVQRLILEVMDGFADGDEHPTRVKFSA